MEKLIIIGKIERIKIDIDKNNKEYAAFILYWNHHSKDSVVEIKRNCITNNSYIINKLKQVEKNDIVYLEGIPKIGAYKSSSGEIIPTYSVNNINTLEILDSNASFKPFSYQNNNETTLKEEELHYQPKETSNEKEKWELDF